MAEVAIAEPPMIPISTEPHMIAISAEPQVNLVVIPRSDDSDSK
jgi:hypothetical protein